MAPKKGAKGKKRQGNRPSLAPLKQSVTKTITKARETAKTVEGAIRRNGGVLDERSRVNFKGPVDRQLEELEKIPLAIAEHIEDAFIMGASDVDVARAREAMDEHLELRGYAELVEKFKLLKAGALRDDVSSTIGGGSPIEEEVDHKETSEKKQGSGNETNRVSGQVHGSHESIGKSTTTSSTMDSVELADNLSKQLASVQQVQQLLLDKMTNMDINQLNTARCLKELGSMFKKDANKKKKAKTSSPEETDSEDGEDVGDAPEPLPQMSKAFEKSSHSKLELEEKLGSTQKPEASAAALKESEESSQPASTLLKSSDTEKVVQKTALSSPVDSQMFDIMVHNNDGIPCSLKQSLLMKLLDKDVLAMMKTPSISEEDYKVLLENLDRQYADKEIATTQYLDLLDSHTFSPDDFNAMENELNRFCSIVNVLKSNGHNPDDPVFMRGFVKRLPIVIMGTVYKKMINGGHTFQSLVKVAYGTIREKHAVEVATEQHKKTNRADEVLTVDVNLARTGTNMSGHGAHKGKGSQSYKSCCLFCQKSDHTHNNCPLSPEERGMATKRAGRCFNCLSQRHQKRDCPSPMNCAKCGQRHHTGLCWDRKKQEADGDTRLNSSTPKKVPNGDTGLKSSTHNSSSNRDSHGVNELSETTDSKESEGVTNLRSIASEQVYKKSAIGAVFSPKRSEESGKKLDELALDKVDNVHVFISRAVDPDANLPFMAFKGKSGELLLALVDCGASTTIVSTQTAKRLKMEEVGERILHFKGFVADSKPEPCTFYEVEVEDEEGRLWSTTCASYHRMNVRFVAPKLSQSDWKFLQDKGVDIQSLQNLGKEEGRPVDMIVGNNVLGNIRRNQWSLPSGRIVEETRLGIVVYPTVIKGAIRPVNERRNPTQSEAVVMNIVRDQSSGDGPPNKERKKIRRTHTLDLDKQLEMSWNLEILGLEPPDKRMEKKELDNELLDRFRKSAVKDEDDKIYVAFPFNGREVDLQDNSEVAMKRLVSLFRTKLKDRKARKAYEDILKQQLASEIIEEVTEEMNTTGPTYYIPHDVVVKEDSTTTKLRIVLDASSHRKGELSLNECLHPGPSLLQPIHGILLRCRLTEFLMIGDIEKAFHQVRIQPEFRNVTRFLWVRDIDKEPVGDNLVIYRFTRLPFGVACSPFLLSVTIEAYLEVDPDELNEKVQRCLYVDNVVIPLDGKEELSDLHPRLKHKFKKMHMNLREFLCNDPEVMAKIPEEDKAASTSSKLLGHVWDSVDDTFGIKIATPPKGIPTKREVVAFHAQTYDPTGLLAPIVVQTKLLIRKLWEKKVPWTRKIPEVLHPLWNEIASGFKDRVFKIPRRLFKDYDKTGVKLILFSDATKDNYAVTAYLRVKALNGEFESKLIYSKSRIRPCHSNFSIPQMELLGLECAVNAAINLVGELGINIEQVVFFTDSTCVLHWVHKKVGNHIGLRWAANRVAKVRKGLQRLSELQLDPRVRYVRTDQNPADIASRGAILAVLRDLTMWHNGPIFLHLPEDQWPKWLEDIPDNPREFHILLVGASMMTTDTEETKVEKEEKLEESGQTKSSTIVPYDRTNSLRKLTSVVRYGLQFVLNIVKKRNARFPEKKVSFGGYTMRQFQLAADDNDEITKRRIARTFIISDHYKDAEETLQVTPPQQFQPQLGADGLYRHNRPFIKSTNPSIGSEMKHPIILIDKHPLARMLVYEIHESLLHQGIKQVVYEVQKRYWIKNIGRLVRKVRASCTRCQKLHARPFKYPYADALPSVRCQIVVPFSCVGLDLFGPLYHKSKYGEGKVWVLIVTCMVTRGVHLEIMPDNTTVSFITSLGRVFARRGVPQYILSDNAPTFKLGYDMMNTDLKTLVNQSASLTSYLAEKEIEVKLITPFSPWKGAVYERLIAIAKNMIFKVIGTNRVSLLDLESLLIEVEGIMNNRPITPNQQHLVDSEAVRPIDFLLPNARLSLPIDREGVVSVIRKGATEQLTRKLMEGTNALKEKLWNRFSEEYLNFLRESVNRKAAHSRITPAVGQVVLVVTNLVKRYKWPLGRIEELLYSSEGKVQSVRVKVGKNVVEKSVSHLIPLEVPADSDRETSPIVDASRNMESSDKDQPVPTAKNQAQKSRRTRPYLHRKAKEPANHAVLAVRPDRTSEGSSELPLDVSPVSNCPRSMLPRSMLIRYP
ncbi:unnamed protein product [Caenorhabditis nigoni]